MNKKYKKMISVILTLVLIIPTIFASGIDVNAATNTYVKSLKVNTSKVNLTSGEDAIVKIAVKTQGTISKKVKIKVPKEDKKLISVKLSKPNKKGVSKLIITAKNVTETQTANIKVTTKAKNMKQKKLSKTLKVTVTAKNTPSVPVSAQTPVFPVTPISPEISESVSDESENSQDTQNPENTEAEEESGDFEATEDENYEDIEGSEDKDTSKDTEDTEDIESVDTESSEDKDTSKENETEKPIPEPYEPTPYEPARDPYIPDMAPEEMIQPIPVSEIRLDKNNLELESADKIKLTATIFPDNADNKEIIWSSKDESIAKVEQTGEVTAIAPGTTEIFVNTPDKTISTVCRITVILMPASVKATVSKKEMLIGETAVISASVVPANATHKNIRYISDTPEIAYVSSLGVITAISPGEATIIAESKNKKKTEVRIRVNELPATGISLNTNRLDLSIGDTTTLIASLYPENATTKDIEWYSLNEDVAIVNEEGVVRALSSGSALIRAYIEELNFDALCRVVVWRDDYVNTVTLDVMDDYTDTAGNVFHNTKLFHETMKIKVGVFKGEEPQTYMPVELSLDKNHRYGNAPDYFELSSPYVITDASGYGYVEIRLKESYKDSNALNGLFQSYVLNAKETFSQKTASIDVRFAAIERSGIVIQKDTIAPSSKIKNVDKCISTTISPDGTKIEYIYSQQASYYEDGNEKNEHPVILTATPYIVLPMTRDDVQSKNFELTFFHETLKSDTISNEATNEILKGYAGVVSGELQELNVALGKEITENCKTIEIALVDYKTGEVIDSKIIQKTETVAMSDSVTMENTENRECYIVISGVSDNTLVVNTDIAEAFSEKADSIYDTGYLIKITGTQALSNNEITIKKELEDAVIWTLVSKEMEESYQSIGMTSEEAKKYIALNDWIYLEEDMTYTCRIPLAPYIGNAIIEAVNPTTGKKLYWAYPTVYKDGIVQLAETNETLYAFQVSANEAFDTTGNITTEGNTAIMDSTRVGFSAIKASYDIPGLDEWNKDNGGELYTYIQWAPMEYVAADN